ncbi:MAG: hypothetical protein COA74_11130 [Gammaproteobacteria bacterium]|nr:MAG: hypothetical protein COA74_11130 [Gammaproteobacteria bacterium]
MLTLTRRSGESIYIYPDYSKVSPSTTIGELFGEDGHILITVGTTTHNKTKINIDAMSEFAIMRTELETQEQL